MRRLLAVALCLWAQQAVAQAAPTSDENEALRLVVPEPARESGAAVEPPAALRSAGTARLEAAWGRDSWRPETFASEPPSPRRARLSAAYSLDASAGPGLRVVLADRIDIAWREGEQGLRSDQVAHTLKEAFLSVGAQTRFLDVGRFNDRVGVAYAYNPTDVLRRYAVVARTSDDPTLARGDRLGVVGLRGQWLWESASLAVLVAPVLRRKPSSGALSPYIERSNADRRLGLRLATRLGRANQAELLWHHDSGSGTQWGANLSSLLGERTVLHAEWLLTREAALVQRATTVPAAQPFRLSKATGRWRPRAALGASVALTAQLSMVLEWHHDGTALSRAQWQALAQPQTLAELRRYLQVREHATAAQDILARNAAFLRLALREWPQPGWSLSAFVRANLEDRSRYAWLQLARERGAYGLSLTLTRASGARATEYGDANARYSVQLVGSWTH